jgi:hypothetical protein
VKQNQEKEKGRCWGVKRKKKHSPQC